MKTKIKWVALLMIGGFVSGTDAVVAQSQTPSQISVREFQAKRTAVYQQVIDLQNAQAAINQQITAIQGLIQERQNAIANLNQLIAASTDPNAIAMYNQKIQMMNDEITNVHQAKIT